MNKARDYGRGRSRERRGRSDEEDTMTELTRIFDTLDTLVEKDPSVKTLIASRYELYTEEMIDETVQFLREKRESSRATTPVDMMVLSESEEEELIFYRAPRSEYESELSRDNITLPPTYFRYEGGFEKQKNQPQGKAPISLINPRTSTEHDHNAIINLLTISAAPEKWINDYILNELKPLFLRIRTLDTSARNELLQDFLLKMFPRLSEHKHRSKLEYLAKHYRYNNWNDWRHQLWASIRNRFRELEKDDQSFHQIKDGLKRTHVKSIFKLWLTNTSSKLPDGSIEQLKKVLLIGFRSLVRNEQEKMARKMFFQSHTDLYTVNINFLSKSNNNIAASLDLSKYDFEDTDQ